VRGAHALPPDQLDAHIQQIAGANPGLSADDLHMKAVVDPARAGNHHLASAVMAGLRKRHDSINAHAQGAAARGDMATAAHLADRAHEHVPDGRTVRHFVEGGAVTVHVRPGNSHRLTPQQFHDHLVGPGTSFDHLMEKGIDHNLAKISQMHPPGGAPPARTGYQEGGAVSGDPAYTPIGGLPGAGGTGGEGDEDEEQRRIRIEGARADARNDTFQGQPKFSYADMQRANAQGRSYLLREDAQRGPGYAEGGSVSDDQISFDPSTDYIDNYGGDGAQQETERRRIQAERAAQDRQTEDASKKYPKDTVAR
jgi:hypothetical protein